MHINLNQPLQSSFLSCEKDAEIILRRLFVEYPQHSKYLKRLLLIQDKNCLDPNIQVYDELINKTTVQDLIKQGCVSLVPRQEWIEHSEERSVIGLSFDNFTPNMTNPQYRDCIIHFDILCPTRHWDLGDYKLRPLKIAGFIDGLLDKTHLTGIGQINFIGANEQLWTPEVGGYTLMYSAVHGGDDLVEPTE